MVEEELEVGVVTRMLQQMEAGDDEAHEQPARGRLREREGASS
jgi:hypothetical protein